LLAGQPITTPGGWFQWAAIFGISQVDALSHHLMASACPENALALLLNVLNDAVHINSDDDVLM